MPDVDASNGPETRVDDPGLNSAVDALSRRLESAGASETSLKRIAEARDALVEAEPTPELIEDLSAVLTGTASAEAFAENLDEMIASAEQIAEAPIDNNLDDHAYAQLMVKKDDARLDVAAATASHQLIAAAKDAARTVARADALTEAPKWSSDTLESERDETIAKFRTHTKDATGRTKYERLSQAVDEASDFMSKHRAEKILSDYVSRESDIFETFVDTMSAVSVSDERWEKFAKGYAEHRHDGLSSDARRTELRNAAERGAADVFLLFARDVVHHYATSEAAADAQQRRRYGAWSGEHRVYRVDTLYRHSPAYTREVFEDIGSIWSYWRPAARWGDLIFRIARTEIR